MELLKGAVDFDRLANLHQRGELFWLDLDDPGHDQVEAVGEALGWHPLAVEDTQEFCQRPKVDAYGDQLLLVYFGATLEEGGPEPVEVHIHISRNSMVTVHRRPCGRLNEVRQRLPDRQPEDMHALVYRVLDALTDSILDVLEAVAGTVERYETQVYGHPRARDRDQMAMLRQSLGRLRRVMVIQRQVFDRTVEQVSAVLGQDGDFNAYYRDVSDHMWRVVDEVDAARESLRSTLETYTNEVQERLTIVATIFLPLTVITGFFGMNFNWMINHIGSAGTFFGLGLGGMLVAGVGIWLWLLRSGLYQPPRRTDTLDDDR